MVLALAFFGFVGALRDLLVWVFIVEVEMRIVILFGRLCDGICVPCGGSPPVIRLSVRLWLDVIPFLLRLGSPLPLVPYG